jgi:hypothetical protein
MSGRAPPSKNLMAAKYINNSKHKDSIRDRWVYFIEELVKEDGSLEEQGIGLITFPAEEMNDLELFASKGFIGWEETETGSLNIIKGRVICFEKSAPIWKKLKTKLINATVENEFEKFLSNQFKAIAKGSIKIFPVDVINLDYDGAISKNSLSIDVVMNMIFELQVKFQKNFSLFMTWPKPHNPENDEPEFLNSLKDIIVENLSDPRAGEFKTGFEKDFESVDNIEYQTLSIIGLTKKILTQASTKKYQITRYEYYSYGETGRQPMISVLYHFSFVGQTKTQNLIYSEDVPKSLAKVSILR